MTMDRTRFRELVNSLPKGGPTAGIMEALADISLAGHPSKILLGIVVSGAISSYSMNSVYAKTDLSWANLYTEDELELLVLATAIINEQLGTPIALNKEPTK